MKGSAALKKEAKDESCWRGFRPGAGNFVGAILTAGLMFYTTQYMFGSGAVGLVALNTANAKASLAFVPALTLGIMCNALVCLAVWMCFSARTNRQGCYGCPSHRRIRRGWL